MRKLLLVLGLAAALAVPAAATAAGPPPVACGGGSCGGGSGWTGCTQQTASHSASVGIASIRHFLVVSYCKSNGIITSLSIAAHGCDTSGLVYCNLGPAWRTGGGVGSGSATFEAHAGWGVTVNPFYNSTDILTLTVPAG